MDRRLDAYLDSLQCVALKAQCMLDCLCAIVDAPEHMALSLQLAESARDLARQLNRSLDSSAVAKVTE